MKILLKFLGWGIGLSVLLVVILALVLPLLFDANDFKDEIAAQMEQQTGRKVVIGGNINFSLLPWLGVKLNNVQLSNAPGYSQPIFVQTEQLAVRVKLWPLLQRQIELDTISIYGLLVNLERNQAGRGNWEDLMAQQAAQPSQPASPEKSSRGLAVNQVSIGGLDIRDAHLLWDDRSTGQRYQIKELALETSPIQLGQPFTVNSQLQVTAAHPALTAAMELTGGINFDLDKQSLTIKDLKLDTNLQGKEPSLAAVLTLSAATTSMQLTSHELSIEDLMLAVTDLKAPGAGISEGKMTVRGAVQGAGKIYRISDLRLGTSLQGETLPVDIFDLDLTVNSELNLEQQTLVVDTLQIDTLGLRLSGNLRGQNITAQPQFHGNLQVDPFSPRELITRFGQTAPQTADANVLSKAAITTQFTGSQHSLTFNAMEVQLDDSQLTGNLSVPNLQAPAIRYKLAIDSINVDRYLPPPVTEDAQPSGQSAPTAPTADAVSLEPLRKLDIDGELKIGELTVAKLKSRDIRLPFKAKQGILALQPATAKLYQGTLQSGIKLDATGKQARMAVDNVLTGIQIGPLLQDLTGEARLTGATQMTSNLTWQGIDAVSIKRSLSGVSRFTFQDGAVKGVNLARLVRQAKAALAGKPLAAQQQATAQTDFSELRGSLQFANGQAKNDDLMAKSPLLRITGQGVANLVQDEIDYQITTTVVGTTQGQGGEELSELKGIPIPIKVTGSLAQPRYALDVTGLLKDHTETLVKEKQDELKQEAQGLLQKQLEKLQGPSATQNNRTDNEKPEDKLRDTLKKLF